MRFGNLKDHGPQGRPRKPLRNLMPQDAHPLRDGAIVVAFPPLARDDKDKSHRLRLRVQNEPNEFRVRFGQSHSVQVDPRLGQQLAA